MVVVVLGIGELIRLTRPCNLDSLTLYFYIENQGQLYKTTLLTLKVLGIFLPDSCYWLSFFSDSVKNRYFSTERIACQSQFWV